ncbi:Nucleosomal histone H3-Lys79 methylase [Friedmanniomyces endolithicus]|nr:Nucleosomal histone H3-Lys79 methylase [Friedmanniomyces endolithicus]KAK0805886.1 Nucleosomal histone H3-Lys79 methylase [Friedmanniomyces endolithicus]KAK0854377.1 Nucleosomal histone H3-Lys79 methylase [Friedmanniomyces endolithicus]KAK0866176.1 Nucleosomal histone H3-Lys79 methylase [Friedmanniomyces endolithicus]KAK0903935.1 Nucleosomal histone H3-Lys79 methylase [Friedmanniomyces endolithicus]
MNWNKTPTPSGTANKPIIRKTTVQVPVAKPAANPAPPHAPASGAIPARRRDPNRFQLSQTSRSKSKGAATNRPNAFSRRALDSVRGVKRKSATPDVNQFSDEDGDSSEVGTTDSEASRKRPKSSISSVDSHSGSRRKLVSDDAFREDSEPLSFIHGADATSAYAAKFKNAFDYDDYSSVELLYPSRNGKERFDLKWPKTKDDYNPMMDVMNTVESLVTFYFPEELSGEYLHGNKAFRGRLNRAMQRESIPEWIEIVEEFNSVLAPLIQDGTIQRELRQRHSLALKWIERILMQICERTVSPKAEKLNAYKVGSSNVYGELLPRLVTDIFRKVQLNHEQIFIDLGSGVGNVVLQAALEIGCESWGIEQLPTPCELAEMQVQEFRARTQLWGLSTGAVNLLAGDMTTHPSIPALLQRADVVLVNNQAFQPDLNDKLLNMFLDLKPGARVVSLKPFVPVGHKMAMRNVDSVVNQFVQQSFEYFSEMPPKRKQPPASTRAAPKPPAAPPTKRRSKLAKEHNLTPDQEAEIAEAFSLFSAPDDTAHGGIATSEIRRCLVALNAPPANQAEMNEILATVDPERTGRVGYEYFVAVAALKMQARQNGGGGEEREREEVGRAFRLFTLGREEGVIGLGDLRRVARELREEVPEAVLRDMVREATGGGLGGVGREEFEGVMRRAGVFG